MSDDQLENEYPEAALSLGVGKPGDGLIILFFKFGDQFRQRIEWAKDGNAFVLLETFRWNESTGQNESIEPPIAPSQEVVKEAHGDKNVVMSIGRSGMSHWSASYQADPNIDPTTNTEACSILVEHACRLNDDSTKLGSQFWLGDVSASLVASFAENGDVHLVSERYHWKLEPLAGTVFEINTEQRILLARPSSISSKRPTTVTWGWQIAKAQL